MSLQQENNVVFQALPLRNVQTVPVVVDISYPERLKRKTALLNRHQKHDFDKESVKIRQHFLSIANRT